MKERFHEALAVDQKSSSDQFLIALLNLMKHKSFDSISISELCQAAGLSRTTFYKFFRDKEALLEYLKEDLALGFVTFKKSLDTRNIPSECVAYFHYFTFWYHVREWVDVLLRDGLWERIAMPDDHSLALLSQRSWEGYLSENDQAVEMMQHFIAAGCVQLVKWWGNNGYQKTPVEMAELVVYTLSGNPLNAKKKELVSTTPLKHSHCNAYNRRF